MALRAEARTQWTATDAACWGGVLGTASVIAHELYIVLFSASSIDDPFLHVMTEMAVVVPGGAMVFVTIAGIRNRLLRGD